MSKPISPSEVAAAKREHIPAAVFDAFNAEIVANFTAGRAKVLQKDVVQRLVDGGMDRQEIFDKGYLNVEEVYRAEGWRVEYDKPGFNETYDASFEFKLHEVLVMGRAG
jgi:hypothetical protein